MKKTFIFVFIVCVNAACKEHNTELPTTTLTKSITVVVDMTDKRRLWPLPDPILGLYHCDIDPDIACRFSLKVIADKKTNPSYTALLADATTTEKENYVDDAQFRKRAILVFYAAVRSSFAKLYARFDTTKSMGHSECWSTITASLGELAKEKAEQKILIIYSDLLDKSDAIDTYQISEAMSYQSIAEKLRIAARVPDNLDSITIIIVNDPPDRGADKKFNTLVRAYKFLLEQKGARVLVQAENTNYTL